MSHKHPNGAGGAEPQAPDPEHGRTPRGNRPKIARGRIIPTSPRHDRGEAIPATVEHRGRTTSVVEHHSKRAGRPTAPPTLMQRLARWA